MFYRFSKTSSKESNLGLVRNCCFARLIDWINSLLDIIFRVSLILFQSSRLKTTDLGLPSGVVINSIFGSSSVLIIVKSPYFLLVDSLLKENGISQQWEGSKKKAQVLFSNLLNTIFRISRIIDISFILRVLKKAVNLESSQMLYLFTCPHRDFEGKIKT